MTARATPDRLVSAARPFGAHLSQRWWVPILLTGMVVVATYVLQYVLLGAAARVEVGLFGKDPADSTLTPLTYAALNLAIILLAPLTLFVLRAVTGTPWRAVLAAGRSFSWRRLARYAGVFAGLMMLLNLLVHLVHPSPTSAFAITGTTAALLVVVLMTTPLQAAAEEIIFRGVLTASYASWFRAVRPALGVGIGLSTALFALLHTTADPWMFLNYLGLGASTALMAVFSRGIEASIAFHVMNNVFAMVIGSLFAHGGGIAQDRTVGAAGPYMLLFLLAEAAAVVLVWRLEKHQEKPRRRRITGVTASSGGRED